LDGREKYFSGERGGIQVQGGGEYAYGMLKLHRNLILQQFQAVQVD